MYKEFQIVYTILLRILDPKMNTKYFMHTYNGSDRNNKTWMKYNIFEVLAQQFEMTYKYHNRQQQQNLLYRLKVFCGARFSFYGFVKMINHLVRI